MPPGQPARPLPRREHEILWRWFLKVSTLSSFVCRSPLGPPCPASRWARKSCHNSIRRLTRRPGTSSPRRMPGARCQPVVPGPAPLLATCGGEIFLEAEWEARFPVPLTILQTQFVISHHQPFGHTVFSAWSASSPGSVCQDAICSQNRI